MRLTFAYILLQPYAKQIAKRWRFEMLIRIFLDNWFFCNPKRSTYLIYSYWYLAYDSCRELEYKRWIKFWIAILTTNRLLFRMFNASLHNHSALQCNIHFIGIFCKLDNQVSVHNTIKNTSAKYTCSESTRMKHFVEGIQIWKNWAL